jgi:hypothetical protein
MMMTMTCDDAALAVFCAENSIPLVTEPDLILVGASALGSYLKLSNTRQNVARFPGMEAQHRKWKTRGGEQTLTFLTPDGVQRLLCSSRSSLHSVRR